MSEQRGKLLKKYYSGYITMNWNDKYGEPPYKGKYFKIDFDVPRDRHNIVSERTINPNGNKSVFNGKEAIILTKNIENAINVSYLIEASLSLLYGNVSTSTGRILYPFPFSKKEKEEIPEEMVSTGTFGSSMVQKAAKIACKASFRRAYYYALFKYRLGCELYSTPIVNLDPALSLYEGLSFYPSEHVRRAYAVIAFYAVIEELGLEIRASAKKQSFIGGKWNPKVKKDLEIRLKKQGININKPFYWNL